MSKVLLVIMSLLMTISAFANIGENPYSTAKGKTLTYDNYYDGDKIGKATIKINESSITYNNKFHIRAYLVFTYDYKAKVTISFDESGVTLVKSKTNDDGDKFKFTIKGSGENLTKGSKSVKAFKGLSLNFVFSKKMRAELTSSWKSFKILDVERGKTSSFKQKSAGTKTIKVKGKKYNVFGVRWVKGVRKGLSYYDVNSGILIKSDVTKGGNTLTLKIKSIK